MSDFGMNYAGICSRRAAAADDTAKLLYAIHQITAISEKILDSTADELKEARDRGRQCQIGRDELERENQALRARLERIDWENEKVIDRLDFAIKVAPEDAQLAIERIEEAMKIIAPPVTPAPF